MPEAIHSKTRRSALPGDRLPMPPSQHSRHFSTNSSNNYNHTHILLVYHMPYTQTQS